MRSMSRTTRYEIDTVVVVPLVVAYVILTFCVSFGNVYKMAAMPFCLSELLAI